jgi:dipeptidyl aminopeptidase/acylaminoacyl peptidase
MMPRKPKELPENHMPYRPTLRDMLLLEVPSEVKVSPNGRRVAISVWTTNWQDNCYETVCQVHDLATGATHPINRTGSTSQVEWLDDQTLALLKQGPEEEDEAQVWLYEGLVGEGWAVTDHKTGVEWFKPFAGGLLFLARHPERDEKKSRADRFGKFTHFEQEESASALYYVGLAALRQYQAQAKAVTEDEAQELVPPVVELSRLLSEPLSIREVIPSPTGDAVYLNCWKRDDLVYERETSTYRIKLDAQAALAETMRREQAKKAKADGAAESDPEDQDEEKEDLSYLGEIARLNLPRSASVAAVAPDGQALLVAHQGRDDKMYTRQDLWLIDLEAALGAADGAAFVAAMRNISAALDRDILDKYWVDSGIFASYVDGCRVRVARLGQDGRITRLDLQGIFPGILFHISAAGRIGLIGANAQSFPEVYLAEPAGGEPSSTEEGEGWPWPIKRLTDFGRAVEGWDLGTVETVRWKSRDGVEIEGVLRKPADFDPAKKYPLVFVVHGGPIWFSPETLLTNVEDRGYYPTVQFLNKGMLVLKPNYRGSTGRGQAFTELNVNNLGVGDMWDLESAIDHLVDLGWVDPERVGCMGWSQGGYISAFVGLHSTRFKAVSVGAGIADWYTYHISNDIPDFTVDYLSGSPFRDRDLYVKTAPISNLANAKTPVLIQHGSDDRRVPFSNATELYRGLKEMGVPVELFVFPGMGHPITKPRENHAVMHQNLAWFSHYLLGEELKLE